MYCSPEVIATSANLKKYTCVTGQNKVFFSGKPFGKYVYHCALKGVKYVFILTYRQFPSRAFWSSGYDIMYTGIYVSMFPWNVPSFL